MASLASLPLQVVVQEEELELAWRASHLRAVVQAKELELVQMVSPPLQAVVQEEELELA